MVEFANARGPAFRAGPFERLCFEGETLVAQPGGVLARHVDHRWVLTNGDSYSRLECETPVNVRFRAGEHSESREVGLFHNFSSIDGVAYGDRRILALCDQQLQNWYSYDLGKHWNAMIVEPA